MTKAIVTRCPYCGAVWRLPDRDTAERGPVRCSECRHSFDATCNLLAVPEDRFPGMPAAPVFTQPSPEISAPIQNSDLRPDPSAIQTSDTASRTSGLPPSLSRPFRRMKTTSPKHLQNPIL